LAAGASAAFFGSWFAGTYESPGDIQYDADGRMYKENFGMASRRAVSQRSREDDAFVRARKEYFEEGISVSRMYLRRGEESAEDIIDKIAAGLRSACTYAGARNLTEFYEKAVVGIQTTSGYNEGKALEKGW
ncbi:IMP dehydrogenase, partial [Candidatus Uhrbacteria bacterium]|nr:IMP dehydrogenase [Candidatus Uhrbacteria bacterium]